MKKQIAVLPGDGIGPEVVKQAIKVLDAIAERYKFEFIYDYADIGAIAIDKTGNPLPDRTLEACLNSDAILFGAIGDPKYDKDPSLKVRPEQGLLKMRKSLELYANIRPVTTYPTLLHLSPLKKEYVDNVDLVIYRELISGIYFGEKGRTESPEGAYDICSYQKTEVERIGRLAFEAAKNRRKKLTLVDKANVLETSRLWRSTIQKIATDYPDVELDMMFVDNAAMQLIVAPAQFDVIVTSNLFGDILSDESSVLVGSLGLIPSASLGMKTSLYEPIHGSYPQAAGKNIANPCGAILSAAMLLDGFQQFEAGDRIRSAVTFLLEKGIGTADLNPKKPQTCDYFGDLVAHLVHLEEDFGASSELDDQISTII